MEENSGTVCRTRERSTESCRGRERTRAVLAAISPRQNGQTTVTGTT